MRKLVLSLALVFTVAVFFTSCRDKKGTTVTIETEAKEADGALERAAKKVDEEVNEEIDKVIEEIGDDN
jgi:hypothetical protein